MRSSPILTGSRSLKGLSSFMILAMLALLASGTLNPAPAKAIDGASFSSASDSAYSWLKGQQDITGSGLVDSFEDYSAPNTPIQIVYTYDQAVATMAFLVKGDTVRAKRVLDTMKSLQATDGSWVNSYYWNFYGQELRKHVGPIMWIVLAIESYEKATGDTTTYHTMATNAIDWSLTFQKPNGALSGGMTTWDSPPNWTPEVWSSTEQNEDAYAALQYFATTTPAKASTYNAAATGIKSFLDTVVWDSTNNRFYGGFKNNTNLIDPNVPLDVNPWGVLSLGLNGTHNYASSLNYVETSNATGVGTLANPRYVQTLTDASTNLQISAYDFDWESDGAAGDPGSGGGVKGADIWFEGSAFMSEAYYMNGNQTKADSIITNIIKKQETNGGIAYSLYGTNNNYWTMAQTKCISSTGWLILAVARYNPFKGTTIGSGTSDTQAPTAPTGLTAGTPTSSSVNLSWTASTDNVGVTGYNIYQGTTLLGTSTTTSYSVTGLTAGTAYSFSVKAKDAAGNVSAASNTVNVTTTGTADTQAPTAPTSLTAGTPTSSSVSLSWTASTDNVGVTGYNVYQGATLLGTSTTNSYSVTGLAASTAYSFSVKAKDAAGNVSAASNTVNVTTASSSSAPYTQGVTVLSSTQAQVWFTPTNPMNVVDIHYNINGGAQQNIGMTNNGGTWQITIPGLASGNVINYSFTYIANGVGNDATGFSYTFTGSGGSSDTQAPTAPTSLTAGTPTSSSVNLSWTASTDNVGVTGYNVYQGATLLGTSTTNSYSVTGLAASTAYSFSVKAKDAAGNVSAASNTVNVTTAAGSTAPYTQGVTVVSSSQVQVWFKPTNTMNVVDIHYTINNGAQQNIGMTNNSGTWTINISSLASGNVINYSFTYIANGVGADSTSFSYTK